MTRNLFQLKQIDILGLIIIIISIGHYTRISQPSRTPEASKVTKIKKIFCYEHNIEMKKIVNTQKEFLERKNI